MKKEANEQVYELKYTGYLMDSDNMYLHYGYSNWSNVSEKKMKKLKSCYKIEISVPEGNELNFCFRANENDWDNNYGNDYCFNPNFSGNYEYVEIISKDFGDVKDASKVAMKQKSTTAKNSVAEAKSATSKKITSKKESTTKKIKE